MKSMNREEIKNLEAKLNEVEGRSDKFEKLIVKKLDEMAHFQKLTQPQTQARTFIVFIGLSDLWLVNLSSAIESSSKLNERENKIHTAKLISEINTGINY